MECADNIGVFTESIGRLRREKCKGIVREHVNL
jgi:hypothetical protein